jgi:hypothetical protein
MTDAPLVFEGSQIIEPPLTREKAVAITDALLKLKVMIPNSELLTADIEYTDYILQFLVKIQIDDSKDVPSGHEPQEYSFYGLANTMSLGAKTDNGDKVQRFLLSLGYLLSEGSTTVRCFTDTKNELTYGVRLDARRG